MNHEPLKQLLESASEGNEVVLFNEGTPPIFRNADFVSVVQRSSIHLGVVATKAFEREGNPLSCRGRQFRLFQLADHPSLYVKGEYVGLDW